MSSVSFNNLYTVGIFAAVGAVGGFLVGMNKRNEIRKESAYNFDFTLEEAFHTYLSLFFRLQGRAVSPFQIPKPTVTKIDQLPIKTAKNWAFWGTALGITFLFVKSLALNK